MQNMTKIPRKIYEKELLECQVELVKLQKWIIEKNLKLVVIFEGRDAAGKGGTIQRITQHLNPRHCKIAALPTPTDKEKTQWYFQRYVAHLPSAGEMVMFDRSWYNRAGVERVMGFCSDDEYWEFLRAVPQFENMLIKSGIILIKYWFSVSDEEQEKRFKDRINNPTKRWKLSDMDMESRRRWNEYSKAKDLMFQHTDVPYSPWYVVESDIKRNARINCMTHLLNQIDYKELKPREIKLPSKQEDNDYVRTPYDRQKIVPDVASRMAFKHTNKDKKD
jgi:polyphosphate kinase